MLLEKLKALKSECIDFSKESTSKKITISHYIKNINHDIALLESNNQLQQDDFKLINNALGYYKNGNSFNIEIANKMNDCERIIKKYYS